MTKKQAEEIVGLLKNGDFYHEDVYEGSIDIEYKNGRFTECIYQSNPYSGEDKHRKNVYSENEFIEMIKQRSFKDMIESFK